VASFEANTTITKIKSVIHGGNVNLTGENTGGTEQILFAGDPDAGISLYYTGSAKLTTHSTGYYINGSSTVGAFSGTGSPESSVTAGIGSIYHRTDGGASTSFYVKESGAGNTGWVAK